MINKQLEHDEYFRQQDKFPICLLLDDFEDPLNVGSFFRLSDALGVEKIYLTGKTPVPPHRKISRTSRSTEKYVDYVYFDKVEEVMSSLKKQNYTIIALEITSNSIDLRNLDYLKFEKICLVAGSENQGIKTFILNSADHTIHIPMLGNNSSMNVATAGAIALFEIISTLSNSF